MMNADASVSCSGLSIDDTCLVLGTGSLLFLPNHLRLNGMMSCQPNSLLTKCACRGELRNRLCGHEQRRVSLESYRHEQENSELHLFLACPSSNRSAFSLVVLVHGLLSAVWGSVTLSGPSSLSLSASPHSPHLRDSCTVHAGLSFLLAALHTPLTATRCEKHPNIPCGAHHVDRNEADSDGAGEEGDNCVEIVSRCPDERVGDR
ncbi:hypothetical protein BLNAU_17782 [Blattamonas nauphoetae]|uniref:Uncharacterized protein n=1 Tax=Blattamonas nauphoetae TaxID=2049346 RepID=A0ABQ9XAJ1_9EUKA|nr:hypothetical protein BLNAU_17782 [Blattamonas nauphoetae]